MRIIGFEKHWPKLDEPIFTTFRFSRKDKDWYVGEEVQVVIRPRQRDRQPMFNATIISKEARQIATITDIEARTDGFSNFAEMYNWLVGKYNRFGPRCTMNKLTLQRRYTVTGHE